MLEPNTAQTDCPPDEQYYIQAPEVQGDDRTRVLKHGEMFAVFDRYGDVRQVGLGEMGLFYYGTRYVSRLVLTLHDRKPLLLNSTVLDDNDLLAVDLMNPDLHSGECMIAHRGDIHLFRSTLLWEGACYMRLRVDNFSSRDVDTWVCIEFEGDFADIFEVRGLKRERRGTAHPPQVEGNKVILQYDGLDQLRRVCEITCEPPPHTIRTDQACHKLSLKPRETRFIDTIITCGVEGKKPAPLSYNTAAARNLARQEELVRRTALIQTSNDAFNDWLKRSYSDLYMMLTKTPEGYYPFAGVPWFSTYFGRDGLITAFQCLLIDPTIARSVLHHLAITQAKDTDAFSDAEPGKILHESREGEMANLQEIPFKRYYGSVDGTPLFVYLASEYLERTGDLEFIRRIWPNIEAALNWIETYGDKDGDGFIEFETTSPKGLVYQGWKDSHDSIMHEDGTLARGRIALCEVQAYVYAAYNGAAKLAKLLDRPEQSAHLLQKAEELRENFEKHFWSDAISMYVLALDGEKRPCRVRTSNAGHCLFGGIADPQRAAWTSQELVSQDMFSDWGIRTLSTTAVRYNPMSYHNGSIWPHDNSMIGWGMAKYNLTHDVHKVLQGIFDMAYAVELHRLPELICGFQRRRGQGPTLYPVACLPQAWAVGSVFLLLQSCLNMSIDGHHRVVTFRNPMLPPFLDRVRISNLSVGSARVSMLLYRHAEDVGIKIESKTGELEIRTIK